MLHFKKRKSNLISYERKGNHMPFTVLDCTRDQLIELKVSYLYELAGEGVFAEVLGRDYDEPSYMDLAEADSIIPDDVIFDHYDGITFVEDDFWSVGG